MFCGFQWAVHSAYILELKKKKKKKNTLPFFHHQQSEKSRIPTKSRETLLQKIYYLKWNLEHNIFILINR